MSLVVSLAFRNLFRNVRRTLITSAAVIAGVAALIAGWGLIDGLDENVIRAQEDALSGHALLRPENYPDNHRDFPLDETRPISSELVRALSHPDVVSWTDRLWFGARIVHGSDGIRIKAVGYDPQRDPMVFPREKWNVQGAWPAPLGEVGIGGGLAKILEIEAGDTVVVEARTKAGALNAMTYRVSGIIHTHNPALDSICIWLPHAAADDLVRPDGYRSHVAVRFKKRDQAEGAVGALGVDGWVGVTSMHEAKDLLALNAFRRRGLMMVVFILMAIAGTGIANTIIMATYERVREIGTLRAMGLSRGGIRRLFLFEGAVLGVCAGGLGALIGGSTVAWFAKHGIDFSDMGNDFGEISMTTVLYMHSSWPPILAAVAFGAVVSVLASIYPALHAARLNPADAVRAD